MTKLSIKILVFFLEISFAVSAYPADYTKLKSIAAGMQPGEWHVLPDTLIPLYSKLETDAIDPGLWGYTGSKSVISAWTSAAFDREGGKMYFMGGGHADYGGNEVYQLDLETLTWSRLTAPAPLDGPDRRNPTYGDKPCPVPNNSPSARHGYDSLVWSPVSKTIWWFNAKGFCVGGYTDLEQRFWEFNPRSRKWVSYETPGESVAHAIATWDPINQMSLVNVKGYAASKAFGPVEIDEHGVMHAKNPAPEGGEHSAVMSWYPEGGYAIQLYKTEIRRLDVDSDPIRGATKLADIPKFIQNIDPPTSAFVYDSKHHDFVVWNGGTRTWSYNPEANEWTELNNLPADINAHSRVYDKMVYVAEADLYVGYNDPAQGIVLYKRPQGSNTQ